MPLPGSTASRELVVKRALEYLDKLAQDESGSNADLQRELAMAYERIGKIQGNSYYSNLGDSEGALKSYRKSLEIRENLIAENAGSRELQNELAGSFQGVGDMLYTINELENGLQHYEKASAIRKSLAETEPDNLNYQALLAENYTRLADIGGLEGYPNLGDTMGALENYRKAVAIGEKLSITDPENRSYQASLAAWLSNLAMLESAIGDNKNAITDGQKALAVFKKITADNPNNTAHKLNMLSAFIAIRYPLTEEMRFDEAAENVRQTIKTLEEMSVTDPKNTFIKRSLGVSYNTLGRTLVEAGVGETAIGNHRQALKIAEDLLKADPTNGEHLRDVAMTFEFMANAQLAAGDYNSALANYRQSLAKYEEQSSGVNSDDLAGVYSGIAKSLAATGSLSEAAETFRRAIPSAEKTAQTSPFNVKKQSRLAICFLEGGKTIARFAETLKGEERKKHFRESNEWLEKSSKIWNELQNSGRLSKLNARFPIETSKEISELRKISL